ncbi:MAG: glycosyltransferase, partial [Desulfurivibrionaceae bacterium]
MSTVPKTSKLSVIIPTLNEAGRLNAALESLRSGRDLVEVIVADGGSSDATVAIAEKGGARVV